VKDFQQRAFEEQRELAKRLGKLAEFNRGEVFKTLDFAEQLRMQMQEHAMFLYLHILAERINNFGKDEP
jgi:crAss001_48 related protein